MDFFIANIVIPVGGLLIALFAGWVMTRDSLEDELGWSENPKLFMFWRILVKFVAPIAIISIFVVNIAG